MSVGPMQTERPRDVYLAACAEIARSMVPLGFRYYRSKPRLVKRAGDLTYEILFKSSPRNCLISPDQRNGIAHALLLYGERHQINLTNDHIEDMLQGNVSLSMEASVCSKQLLQWRCSQSFPLRTDDYLAGDDVGKLRQPPSPVTFNLAQRTTRQQTTVDAGTLAHEVALPFFELFLNPSDLIDHLLEKDLPGFWEALAFDYVLCFGNRQLGLALLRRRLSGDGALQARFAE